MDDNLPQRVIDIPLPPPTENIGKKIIMFGTPPCPDCARIKKFFADNAIEYEYHDVTVEKDAGKWLTSFSKFVPVVIMPDKTLLYSPSNDQLVEKIKLSSTNQKVQIVEPQVFDTIIIGGGPAGLSAAIYAVRKSLKVLLVTKNIGGQAALSGNIENYLGFSLISGGELTVKFREDVEKFTGEGIWVKEGVEVTNISGEEGNFTVKTHNNQYHCKTILIASGRIPRLLRVPGEKEFLGKGVATCATCDAPLFKGKDVAVVGGGNSALDAAYSLTKIAKSITIINISDGLRGDEALIKNVKEAPNILIMNNSQVLEITGSKFVEGIKVRDNSKKEEKVLPVSGVFTEIGWIPSASFDKLTAKNGKGEILVDEFGKTSVDGIWAAGDVNNLWGEQIIIAAGEGAKVALIIAEHISKIPHQITSNPHQG